MTHRDGCPMTYLDKLQEEERHLYYCTCWWTGEVDHHTAKRMFMMFAGMGVPEVRNDES